MQEIKIDLSILWVCIMLNTNLEAVFKPISDRICLLKTCFNKKKINIISAYAPTSETTDRAHEKTDEFNENLEGVKKSLS